MHLLFVVLMCLTSALAYVQKEDILSGTLLEELAERMRKESDLAYLDNTSPLMGSRSLEEEQFDSIDYDAPLSPSIRDQEYLRHSSLLSSKYDGDGTSGGDNQRVKPQNQGSSMNDGAKSKTSLPAYCNPPNPCPFGYGAEEGCLEIFENTAAFSRRFQEVQDCMCDTEHMFDCPHNTDPFMDDSVDSFNDFEFNQFVRQQMKGVQGLHPKNLAAKKLEDELISNPFMTGERLPVAAKKGNRAL